MSIRSAPTCSQCSSRPPIVALDPEIAVALNVVGEVAGDAVDEAVPVRDAAAGGDFLRYRHTGDALHDRPENGVRGIAGTVVVGIDELPGQLPRRTFDIGRTTLHRLDVLRRHTEADAVMFVEAKGNARIEGHGLQARRLDAVAPGPVLLVVELGAERSEDAQANRHPVIDLMGEVEVGCGSNIGQKLARIPRDRVAECVTTPLVLVIAIRQQNAQSGRYLCTLEPRQASRVVENGRRIGRLGTVGMGRSLRRHRLRTKVITGCLHLRDGQNQ